MTYIGVRNTINVVHKKVLDVYFASITEETTFETVKEKESEHIVKKGDNLSAIASKNKITLAKLKGDNAIKSNALKIGQKLTIKQNDTKTEKGKKVTFTKLDKATLGEEVYIIIKTENLDGIEIEINVMQGKEKLFAEKDRAISLLKDDKKKLKTIVGEYAKNDKITNKDDFKDWAIVKIALAPKEEKTLKTYTKALKDATDKKTYLFLAVDACTNISNQTIFYKDGQIDKTSSPNYYLNEESKWLELGGKKVCSIDPSIRSHFVIHCTAGTMTTSSIKTKTKYDIPKKKKRSAAHIYVNLDGTKLEIWPLTEKNVWATKIESKKNLKGQMFHIELNYGSPTKPSEAQYKTLADLYVEASEIEGCWPIIAPHIEIDRGIADGHQDPTDFDYNHFYSILKTKGVPIDEIPKFDHDRYWGNNTYRVPWSTDKTTWPPILKGNPHK